MQNAEKGINILNGRNCCFYYLEISFRPIFLKLSMIVYTNILPTSPDMAILKNFGGGGGVTWPSGTNGSKYTVKAGAGKPLKGEGGILHILVSVPMRHQPKIVQWLPISLLLKSLGLDIYKTTPPSATRAVVQRYDTICANGGHLGFLQKETIKC